MYINISIYRYIEIYQYINITINVYAQGSIKSFLLVPDMSNIKPNFSDK